MTTTLRLCFLLGFGCFIVQIWATSFKDASYSLARNLLNESFYMKTVIPIESSNSSINMTMQLQLLSIESVSERDQTMITNSRLSMMWNDAYLAWTPDEYAGINSLLLPQDQIWLPDITVGNSVKQGMQIGFDNLPCRVFDSGTVLWQPMVVIASSCNIDVTYFPMDTQVCHIIFETLASLNSELSIEVDHTEAVNLDGYGINGQWDLQQTYGANEALDNGQKGNKIVFSFLLKRRRAFYLLNLVIPILLLSLTGTLALALPADAGEKMGMCLTVLLAYTVYLSVVSEQLPNTSVQTSVLAVYLAILTGITTMTVILSVIILRLHHRPQTDPVGHKTAMVAKILRLITCNRLGQQPKTSSNNSVTPLTVSTTTDALVDDLTATKNNTTSSSMSWLDSTPSAEDEERLTWQEVAAALDCFLFLFMSAVSLISTAAVMGILFIRSEKSAPKLYEEVTINIDWDY